MNYNQEADAYRCPADKPLTYRETVRAAQVRAYRSRPADRAGCQLKPQCTNAGQRAVTRLVAAADRCSSVARSGRGSG